MTWAEVVIQINRHVRYDLGAYTAGEDGISDESSAENLVIPINLGLEQLAREVEKYDPNVTFTLTADDNRYTLTDTAVFSKRLIKPNFVTINGSVLRDSEHVPGLWELGAFQDKHQHWQDDTSGTPTIAFMPNSDEIMLWRKPNAACVTAAQNYVAGTVYPTKFVYTAADPEAATVLSPDLALPLHEALCYLVAVKLAMPNASIGEQWNRMTAYRAEYKEAILKEKYKNANLRYNNLVTGPTRHGGPPLRF